MQTASQSDSDDSRPSSLDYLGQAKYDRLMSKFQTLIHPKKEEQSGGAVDWHCMLYNWLKSEIKLKIYQ